MINVVASVLIEPMQIAATSVPERGGKKALHVRHSPYRARRFRRHLLVLAELDLREVQCFRIGDTRFPLVFREDVVRRRHIGQVAFHGVDRTGVVRDLEGLGDLVEGAVEILGGPVIARHLQQRVLVLRNISVVVFA